jgi:hypothetical protein
MTTSSPALQITLTTSITPSVKWPRSSSRYSALQRYRQRCVTLRPQHTYSPSSKALTHIVKTAYESEPDSGPNILLIDGLDMVHGPMPVDPTEPPLGGLPGYPFLSRSVEELGSFLDTIPEGWPISTFRFLVVDEQSVEDETVLFVERGIRRERQGGNGTAGCGARQCHTSRHSSGHNEHRRHS